MYLAAPVSILDLRSALPEISIRGSAVDGGFVAHNNEYLYLASNRAVSGAIHNTGRTTCYIKIASGISDSYISLSTGAINNTDATERLRVDKDGNIGIGTSIPGYPIHVYKNSADAHLARFEGAGSDYIDIYDYGINSSKAVGTLTGVWNATTNLQEGGSNLSSIYEPIFSKNDAFNKNFAQTGGTGSGTTVAYSNHTHVTNYGIEAIKTLSSGVALSGINRNLVIAAESGTSDDMTELTGLTIGDKILLRADTGDTITVKHNDSGATIKILIKNDNDYILDEQHPLELILVNTNELAEVDNVDFTAGLLTKIIEIGDWNMDATPTVSITHGISSGRSRIRTMAAVVRNDADEVLLNLEGGSGSGGPWGSIGAITDTAIDLSRGSAGPFDSVLYDATSYNRGWLTIQYTIS